jgi:hypothetical protein
LLLIAKDPLLILKRLQVPKAASAQQNHAVIYQPCLYRHARNVCSDTAGRVSKTHACRWKRSANTGLNKINTDIWPTAGRKPANQQRFSTVADSEPIHRSMFSVQFTKKS